MQAELSNSGDVLSCSVALDFVENLARGTPGAASALAQALGSELTSLLSAPDAFLRCQAIRVGEQDLPCFSPYNTALCP